MTWRARIWTRIAAAFMSLVALLLVAGSGLAQEFDYTLEELEDKIDKSPWGPKLLLASPGLDPGAGSSRSSIPRAIKAELDSWRHSGHPGSAQGLSKPVFPFCHQKLVEALPQAFQQEGWKIKGWEGRGELEIKMWGPLGNSPGTLGPGASMGAL